VYKFATDANVPSFLVIDGQKVIQILVNLVSNASKFTGVGGSITVSVQAPEIHRLRFCVTDTGVGIAHSDQLGLFNTFTQLQSSVQRGRGTGLGLAICKSLTELLGGTVDVTSALGQGSTFSFTTQYEGIDTIGRRIEEDSRALKGKCVLVVDDNEDNRIFLSDMLFRWGMHPIVCASALEGLRLVMKDRYEFALALIDVCMPGTSGPDLAAQLKDERPMLPLIALSSADEPTPSHHFEQTLRKPVTEAVLFDIVLRVVCKSEKPSAFIGSDDELSSDSSSSSPSEKFNRAARILVAEDNSQNRNLVVSMLRRLEYMDVDTCADGEGALRLMDQDKMIVPYDVLLLDLRMPNTDGYQVIEEIRRRGWRMPKIVVVSASVLDCDRDRCAELGVKYFVRKPIQMSQLSDVMLRVTER